MHRPTAAVLALLQGMAILACPQKSEEIPRSRRSIIGVPTFVGDRFGQDQQRSVVGYDGQCRRMFEEAADENDCCNAYYSAPQLLTAQQPAEPENLRSARNNDAWWLAVIENANRNNEQLQQEINTKEDWRKYQWALSCIQ
ncbi:hypothetical protein ACI65C_009325 [Semiaphis heraclei]